jgi:predicted nucleic acid-binding protein
LQQTSPSLRVAVSVPLVAEYESALLRHLGRGQRPEHVEALVDRICAVAVRQEVFFLWRPLLPDPNDDMVVEVAVASRADFIVTHNLRDFGPAKRFGFRVLAPSAFLKHLLRS